MNLHAVRVSRGAATAPPLLYLAAGLLAGLVLSGAVALLAWPAPAADPGIAGGGGPGGGDFGGGQPPSPVEVALAVEIVAAESVELLATAAPIRESLVASEVDGLVVEMAVDDGSFVRQGQLLVRLRTADLEQQLAAGQASLRETQARLERAEAEFRRFSDLRERNVISESELEQARADRDALARAADRLQAEIARLDDQLERSQVRAPFSGQVTRVAIEVGEWVGRGDPVATVVDLSEIEIQMPIAERFISAVEPGFPVTVRMDAFPGESFAGRVTTIVPAAVPEARTFPVLVRVANPGGRIKPGMAARVSAQLGDPRPTLMVSKDAVIRRGTEVYVMKVVPSGAPMGGSAAGDSASEGGMIAQVPVVLGPARGQWQVVEGDLVAGDRIVVRGNERVFPGQPVTVAAVREIPLPTADPDRPIATDPRSGGGA